MIATYDARQVVARTQFLRANTISAAEAMSTY
jgi:hypothetical protein